MSEILMPVQECAVSTFAIGWTSLGLIALAVVLAGVIWAVKRGDRWTPAPDDYDARGA